MRRFPATTACLNSSNLFFSKSTRGQRFPAHAVLSEFADNALLVDLVSCLKFHLGFRKNASCVMAKAQSSGMRFNSCPSPQVSV